MVVKSILFVLQALLFLVLFALGSVFLPFLPFLPVLQMATAPGHVFVYDGVLLAVVAWVALLLIEASRRRIKDAGGLTTVALLVALGLGFLMRFGFKSL